MNVSKKGKKKGCRLFLAFILAGSLAQAESFYQTYVNISSNGITVTNLGINPVLVSGITCQSATANQNDMYVTHIRGANTTLVYTVAMSNHTSFYLSKSDLAGLWLIQNDKLSVNCNGTVTNRVQVNLEESR